MLTVGLTSILTGCAVEVDPDATDDEIAVEEDVAEAEGALVTCYGESCNGQDPGTTGCDVDAQTVKSGNILSGSFVVGTIAIRYSPSCGAAWARASTTGAPYFIRSEITRSSPYATAQAASPSAVTALRSPMIGVVAGSTFTATGRLGPSYGYYPATGIVSKTF